MINLLEFSENKEEYDNVIGQYKLQGVIGQGRNKHELYEGDNLALLNRLAAEGRKVDVIYIDPPYNTGNQFTYNDNRKDNDWLSFMYKRLKKAKEVMNDNGVIFVSIDDNMQAKLKLLMDKVYGEGNFINNIVVETGNTNGGKVTHKDKTILKTKEYLFVYSKNKKLFKIKTPFEPIEGYDKKYNIIIEDNRRIEQDRYNNEQIVSKVERGKLEVFRAMSDFKDKTKKYTNRYKELKTFLKYEDGTEIKDIKVTITNEGNELFLQKNAEGKIQSLIPLKRKIKNGKITKIKGDIWKGYQKFYTNINKEGGVKFKNGKKSVFLIKDIINLHPNPNAIVLDFFAGSGTTGQAVMELNEEDGGNRKFILCTTNEINRKTAANFLYSKGYIDKPHINKLNKFKKENKELYDTIIKSKEYNNEGVFRKVLLKRIQKVIEGYVCNNTKKSIESLQDNAAAYYRLIN